MDSGDDDGCRECGWMDGDIDGMGRGRWMGKVEKEWSIPVFKNNLTK